MNKNHCYCYPYNGWVLLLRGYQPNNHNLGGCRKGILLRQVRRTPLVVPKPISPSAGSWVKLYKHRVMRCDQIGSWPDVGKKYPTGLCHDGDARAQSDGILDSTMWFPFLIESLLLGRALRFPLWLYTRFIWAYSGYLTQRSMTTKNSAQLCYIKADPDWSGAVTLFHIILRNNVDDNDQSSWK